jgi:hypothetical protein
LSTNNWNVIKANIAMITAAINTTTGGSYAEIALDAITRP